MNNSTLISIIIPVYNIGEFLNRCLESVTSSTYRNLEIILVDDGSKDNSASICDLWKAKDNRIKVIHKHNEGVSRARQDGINVSSGRYIGFVDGDDYIEPDMYELLLNNAIEYDADISHCGYRMLFDDGREKLFYGSKQLKIQNNAEGQKDLLTGDFIEPGLWNKLYKKELFSNLNYDSSIKINEDLMINFLLFQKSQLSVYVDECKYNYCIRNTSASRKELNHNQLYDPIHVRDFIRNRIDQDLENLAHIKFLYSCMNSYNAILITKKDFKSDNKAIRKILIDNMKHFKLCRKAKKVLLLFLVYCPFLYEFIYKIYYSYFQVRKYE